MLAGAACAICFEAALSWDGAYLLFKTLDGRSPFVSLPWRYCHAVFQAPAVLAQLAGIGTLGVLRPLFAAPYALLPSAALGVCWWIVRSRRPALFVWPVLSITLANLPGAFFQVSEGPIAIALFWPILLALLVGSVTRGQLVVLYACAALILTAHPIAVPLFAAAAVVAAVQKRRVFSKVALVALFAAAAVSRALVPLADYESQGLAIASFVDPLRTATRGWPRWSLAATACATVVVALQSLFVRRSGGRAATFAWSGIPAAFALGAGVAMIPWAANVESWASAHQYRFVMNAVSAVFLGAATIEGIVLDRVRPETADLERLWQHRRATVMAAGLGVVLLFFVQGRAWSDLKRRFLDELMSAPGGRCVPVAILPSARGSMLRHWSSTSLAMVLQGQDPRRLAVHADGCEVFNRTGSLPLAPWDVAPYPRAGGWFGPFK